MSFTLPTPTLEVQHAGFRRFQRTDGEWLLEFPAPDKLWSANTRIHHRVETTLKRVWRAAVAEVGEGRIVGEGPWAVMCGLPFRRANAHWDPHNWTSTVVKVTVDGLGPKTTTKKKDGTIVQNPGAGWWSDDDVTRIKILDSYALVCRKPAPMTVAVHGFLIG